MDESAMLRGLIDMILNNTCLNYEHKDLMIDDDSNSYSNCLAERKEEYEKEIGEEKDGI